MKYIVFKHIPYRKFIDLGDIHQTVCIFSFNTKISKRTYGWIAWSSNVIQNYIMNSALSPVPLCCLCWNLKWNLLSSTFFSPKTSSKTLKTVGVSCHITWHMTLLLVAKNIQLAESQNQSLSHQGSRTPLDLSCPTITQMGPPRADCPGPHLGSFEDLPGDFTISPGNLFQYVVTIIVRRYLLMLTFYLCLLPLVLGTT